MGVGVVLLEGIEVDTFVGEYVGEVISKLEYHRRSEEYTGMVHSYFMALSGEEIIDATRVGGWMRFVNHSCDPNCVVEKWSVQGEERRGLFSVRPIARNEELTFDYKMTFYQPEIPVCLCNSTRCRGTFGTSGSSARPQSSSSVRYSCQGVELNSSPRSSWRVESPPFRWSSRRLTSGCSPISDVNDILQERDVAVYASKPDRRQGMNEEKTEEEIADYENWTKCNVFRTIPGADTTRDVESVPQSTLDGFFPRSSRGGAGRFIQNGAKPVIDERSCAHKATEWLTDPSPRVRSPVGEKDSAELRRRAHYTQSQCRQLALRSREDTIVVVGGRTRSRTALEGNIHGIAPVGDSIGEFSLKHQRRDQLLAQNGTFSLPGACEALKEIFGSVFPSQVRQKSGFPHLNVGEIDPVGVDMLLEVIGGVGSGDVFVDIGAGLGNVVVQVALQASDVLCVGVEIRDAVCKLGSRLILQHSQTYAPLSRVSLIHGDVAQLNSDLSEALSDCSIVYSNNVTFKAETNQSIMKLVCRLQRIRFVAIFNAVCPRHATRCTKQFCREFELFTTLSVPVTWTGSRVKLEVFKRRGTDRDR